MSGVFALKHLARLEETCAFFDFVSQPGLGTGLGFSTRGGGGSFGFDGLGCGVIPAVRASRVNPVISLRVDCDGVWRAMGAAGQSL